MIRKQSSVITKSNCRIAKLNFDPDKPPDKLPIAIYVMYRLTFFVYILKARLYTEKIQETRGLLDSVGTDHVQVQIFVQIQMKAIVFILL